MTPLVEVLSSAATAAGVSLGITLSPIPHRNGASPIPSRIMTPVRSLSTPNASQALSPRPSDCVMNVTVPVQLVTVEEHSPQVDYELGNLTTPGTSTEMSERAGQFISQKFQSPCATKLIVCSDEMHAPQAPGDPCNEVCDVRLDSSCFLPPRVTAVQSATVTFDFFDFRIVYLRQAFKSFLLCGDTVGGCCARTTFCFILFLHV